MELMLYLATGVNVYDVVIYLVYLVLLPAVVELLELVGIISYVLDAVLVYVFGPGVVGVCGFILIK